MRMLKIIRFNFYCLCPRRFRIFVMSKITFVHSVIHIAFIVFRVHIERLLCIVRSDFVFICSVGKFS